MNLEPINSYATTRKRLDALLSISMGKLAMMLGVTLTSERIQAYLEPLSDLNENEIEMAFKEAAKRFKPRYNAFPSPAEIIDYSKEPHSHSGFIDDSKTYLGLPEKTPNEPLTAEEARALLHKSQGKSE